MLDLRDYFLDNITSDSAYYKYKDDIEYGVPDYSNQFSEQTNLPKVLVNENFPIEIIDKFKTLILPRNNFSEKENLEFLLICYYLNNKNYYIKQFPTLLENPTTLSDFSNIQMRNYLFSKGRSDDHRVRWAERRSFTQELEFLKGDSISGDFNEPIEELFTKISTRGSTFDNMENQEKLKDISNLLEHILKENNKYKPIDTKDTLGLISSNFVKDYRNILHCYRHGEKSDLDKRDELKDKEFFLIHLGISIIHAIGFQI